MWTLDKLSSPGWEKQFPSKRAAQDELKRHVCRDCLMAEISADPSYLERTTCGLEYEIYETAKGPHRRFIKIDR